MADGPDITRIAAMIGDPARASMLCVLMDGRAHTAGELAEVAGVTPATASGHLTQMTEAGLIWPRAQGRHRYFAIADDDVAQTLETLTVLAEAKGHLRSRPGPRDEALRHARVCYDHLAGHVAVEIYRSMSARGFLSVDREDITLTEQGNRFIQAFGIDPAGLRSNRRPLVRACLDWSERRSHLAGGLGAALLMRFEDKGWLTRDPNTRHAHFTPTGEAGVQSTFLR